MSVTGGATASVANINKLASTVYTVDNYETAPDLVGFTTNYFISYGIDIDPVSDNGQVAIGTEIYGNGVEQ